MTRWRPWQIVWMTVAWVFVGITLGRLIGNPNVDHVFSFAEMLAQTVLLWIVFRTYRSLALIRMQHRLLLEDKMELVEFVHKPDGTIVETWKAHDE